MSIEVERKKRPELQNNVMRFDEGCFYRVAKATVRYLHLHYFEIVGDMI